MKRMMIAAGLLVIASSMGCRHFSQQQQRGIERYQPQKRSSYQIETDRDVARARPPSYETDGEPSYARLSTGKTKADRKLAANIERRLVADERLGSAEIHVRVRGSVVTLKGNVADARDRRRAGQLARNVRGVKRVDNRIVVSGAAAKTDDDGFAIIRPDR